MRKKILHIQILPILSGVQNSSLYILQNLDLEKYEPWLVCAPNHTNRENSMISEAEKAGVKVVTFTSLKREIGLHDISAFINIFKLCRKEKFDIVHTMTSKGGFLGRVAAKISGCSNVIHTIAGISFHKFEPFYKRILYYVMELIAGFFCDYVVSVNKFYRKYYWFIPDRKFRVIYNTFNNKGLTKKENRSDNVIKLIFVGRLDKQKSPQDIILAAEILKVKGINFHLTMVGEGEFYESITKMIKEKYLEDFVTLSGWCDNVGSLLAQHDIFCLTSIYEAFGIVFLEAGYTGLASVATNVEGIPEVVLHNKTGLLVPPKNPDKFAEAIYLLAKDKELRESFGRNAEEWVTEEFTLAKMLKGYLKLYEL